MDLDGAKPSLEADREFSVSADDDRDHLPEGIREEVERRPKRGHRTKERRLDPGETAYVLGPARRDPESGTGVTIGPTGDGDGTFMFTDGGKAKVRKSVGLQGAFSVVAGTMFGGIPLALLVVILLGS